MMKNLLNAGLRKYLATLVLCGVMGTAWAQTDTLQHVNPNSKNSKAQQQKPYVILISADGFRYDYAEKYNAENLLKLSRNGIKAESMIPSFPSLTFPNHYTLVTGLYPSKHGLVNNSFYDKNKNERYSMGAKDKVRTGSWYGGTPLWVLAEKQEMVAASMFWVGSEADIQGLRPTYYYDYTEKIEVDSRIQKVKEWLSMPEDRRPHFITFYLSEPDHAGHRYGPNAAQTVDQVKSVDSVIYKLNEMAKATKLPVNFIFVSDHGMTAVDTENPLSLPASIDLEKFIIPASGTMVVMHAKDTVDIMPAYRILKEYEKDNYKVYLKTEMPEHFHYSAKEDKMDRIGDILVIPNWPKVFSKNKPGIGHHGFDPSIVKDMHATFMAWGPAFKKGVQIPAFENVNVYPLIAEILDLRIDEPIDGDKAVLKDILK